LRWMDRLDSFDDSFPEGFLWCPGHAGSRDWAGNAASSYLMLVTPKSEIKRPAMMVLPAPGSSASRKRNGWRGNIDS
jgi:hypothetical protein